VSKLISARTASTDVDGVRIHYCTAGPVDGPVMLLVHGYPEMSIAWRRTTLPLASAGFRLIMPDLRGAGGSARPLGGYDKRTLAADLAGVLDAEDIVSPVTIAGHDIGAMVAYAFARRYPERTARLAILDSVIPGTAMFDEVSRDGAKVWHFHFHQAPDLPEALTHGREALYLERYYHDMAFDPYAIDAETFAFYVRHFQQPGAMRAGFEYYRSFSQDVSDNRQALAEHGRLRMPVLALAGAGGRYAERIGPMMEEVADNVSVGVIPRAGHWLAEENPEAVADALTAFVSQEIEQ
jgi:pimeloyl-ACP methyl ester carboxylesterase